MTTQKSILKNSQLKRNDLYIRATIVATVEPQFYDMTRRQQNHVGYHWKQLFGGKAAEAVIV